MRNRNWRMTGMFCDDFKRLFPKYGGMRYVSNNAVVNELDHKAKVKKIIWKNSGCQIFDPEIVKNFSSFFDLSSGDEFFKKDCDGILLFEASDSSKYIVLCELKSTFDTNNIYKAYKQIISSFIKICALMYFLPNFNKDDIKVKGFIFTKPKKNSFLRDLQKRMLIEQANTQEESFVSKLCSTDDPCIITPTDCPFIKSLGLGTAVLFDKLELCHIEVERPDGVCEMDATQYIP